MTTVGCVIALASVGCAGGTASNADAAPGRPGARPADSADDERDGRGGYVIERQELVYDDRNVLAAMVGRVPNMRVERTGRCPMISFRGRIVEDDASNPLVYIDGTRAMDTCLLDGLAAADLRRVEVYPTGRTSRPGYATSAHGLILLFSRRR